MAFSSWIRSWKRSLERRLALYQTLRRKVVARRQATQPRLEALEDRWLLSPYLVTSNADSGSGTLRDAITQANMAGSTITEIDFTIGTSGSAQTISLTSQLPTLTANGVFINGLSQGGSSNTKQLITLDGTNAGSSSDGLLLQGSGNIVSGLVLSNFTKNGIEVAGSANTIGGTATGAGSVISGNSSAGVRIDSGTSGVVVQGNYIGTDSTGTKAVANSIGVWVIGQNATIGGTVSGAGNVISGNSADGVFVSNGSMGTQVQDNYIGTDATGTKAVGNNVGILTDGTMFIGGTTTAARNVISGNTNQGIYVASPGVQVQGNYIGIDATGSTALANSIGVETIVPNVAIGGTLTGAGNVISGNSLYGVFVAGTSGVLVQGNYIGTNSAGSAGVGNSIGVDVDVSSEVIGGTAAGSRNIISGNSTGVRIESGISNVSVQGNYIGTDVNGANAVGNSIGVYDLGASTTVGGTSTPARNVISGNSTDGLLIGSSSSGIQVLGNYIGTDASGTTGVGNSVGIGVSASNQVIGGTSSSALNVISGNSGDGVLIDSGVSGVAVQGNYIGTDLTGAKAVANSVGIEVVGNNNTIGGTISGALNLISGNSSDGVRIGGGVSGVAVQGNHIGTDVTGTIAVANKNGIEVGGTNNTIGGAATGAGNVISGNSNDGVFLIGGGSGVTVQGNYVGTDLNGTNAVANFNGFEVQASNVIIGGTAAGTGNTISGNSHDGVLIDKGPAVNTGVQVQGNYIGTDLTGAKALGNSVGVEVSSPLTTIGGTASGARNIISGNSGDGVLIDIGVSGSQVQGNYIGTDLNGAKAVANNIGVYVQGSNNTVGGTIGGSLNVISGNGTAGVYIDSGASGVAVQGNYIGTDSSGTKALANTFGIEVSGSNNTIGGTSTTALNVISGNSDGVYVLSGASGVAVQGNYIGTDLNGTSALANNIGVYDSGSNNIIGGTTSGSLNVISGNSSDGVLITGSVSGVAVQGNFIGTDLTGANALANNIGVYVQGSNNTIGGTTGGSLNVISGNGTAGVYIESSASGVAVQGNYIGTDVNGVNAVANNIGVSIVGSDNTIGGTSTAARNIISANSQGVFVDGSGASVQGNYIGTDVTGAKALGNTFGIHVDAGNDIIGGTTSDARNLISGNQDGVFLDSGASGAAVQGNYIGTDLTGAKALANNFGVYVQGSNNTIGGTTSGSRNVISGNSTAGVYVPGGASGVAVQGNYIGTDLTGAKAVANTFGVEVSGSNNTIGGTSAAALNLISGNSDGVYILSGASGVQVQGNYIGTDLNGTSALANNIGVYVQGSNDTIGGTTSGSLNVISGNGSDGVFLDSSATGVSVLGNYIGTDVTGANALANNIGVSIVGSGNTIGGTSTAARNVISANSQGIFVDASGVSVQGNFIGTDVTGAKALANNVGIQDSGNNNTLGGTVKGAGNIISGNSGDGVLLSTGASAVTVQGNYIGLGYLGTSVIANGSNGIEVQGKNNLIGGNSGSNYYVRNFLSGNTGDGLLIDSGATGNQVLGNFIGLGVSGTHGVGNSIGMEIAGTSNTIGGTSALGTNYISGNLNDGILLDSTASANLIQGTDVGTDYAGRAAVANGGNGIEVMGNGNTLGSTTTTARNILSGNSGDGVRIDSGVSGTLILGNFIGLNALDAAVPNAGNGVNIAGTNNTIGGTATGARNYISGNINDGVLLESSASGNVVLGNFLGVNLFSSAAANHNGIEVAGTQNTIGGSASGSFNVISGNTNDGVLLDSTASGNAVLGNNVGQNVYGTVAVGNSIGIEVAGTGNTVGASYAVAPNVISGNSKDGMLLDSTASGNQVLGNYIGTNHTGTAALANQVGIEDAGSSNTIGGSVLGAKNVISGNTGDGVLLDSTAAGEILQGNYIGLAVSGRTALANGSNGIEVQGTTIIGGDSASNYFTRNFLSGNGNDGLLIDGSASGNLVQGNFIGVDVSGTNGVGNAANGIEIAGTSNTIGGTTGGLANVISGNKNDGILLDSTASANLVLGNRVGIDYTGENALANSGSGVEIQGNGNTVGGTVSGARNIISDNSKDGVLIASSASGTLVQGNYIGINFSGAALGNGDNGVNIAGNSNTVGGTVAAARNIISGNANDGVLLAGSGNQVLGNYLGTNVLGNASLSNSIGIEVAGNSNIIGGSVSGSRNIISGNATDGVKIDSGASGNTVLGNYIGLNASGNADLSNAANGVEVAGSHNTVGASYAVGPNVISGNVNDGVLLDRGSSANQVLGNNIGTNPAGTASLGNGSVGIEDGGNGNTIGGSVLGARNIISGNTGDGVLNDYFAYGETMQGNLIGLNLSGNIALGNGGNGVEIQGAGNTIGGNSVANYFVRNFISGNGKDGVLIDSINASNGSSRVEGNFIGVGISGTNGVGNLGNGIEISGTPNTIGGTSSGYTNVISGNGKDGVLLDSTAIFVVIQHNYVGTDYTGTSAVGNGGNGVTIVGNRNTLGGSTAAAGNTIANNGGDGVLVSAGVGNVITSNPIFANNTALGIALSNGGNNNLAAPNLLTATYIGSTLTVTGSFTAPTANVSYVLQFFANPTGDPEGKVYLGSQTVTPATTGTQPFTFTTTTTTPGTYPLITATVTDSADGTSEFSPGIPA